MSKRGILLVSFILFLFLLSCTPSAKETLSPQAPPAETLQEQVTPPLSEPSPSAQPQEKSASEPSTSEPTATEITSETSQKETPSEFTPQNPACTRTFSPQFNAEPYYSGKLFDAHFHMPPAFDEPDEGWRPPVLGKEVTLQQILCLLDKEKVVGAAAFYMWNFENLEKSLQDAAQIKKQSFAGMHLFLIPSELEAEELDDILTKNPGVFEGFGEIVYYSPEPPRNTPDDAASLETAVVAAKHGAVVMFHPDKNQKAKVEAVLQKNPTTKFLMHGWESEDYISELMDKYPNVYYSIDSAVLYQYDGMLIKGPQNTFLNKFKSNFNFQVQQKVDKWKPRIEKHPDKFMWGTDRAADWHFTEEISILFEEFARAFIGKLPKEVQEKYAYQNAEKLFSG